VIGETVTKLTASSSTDAYNNVVLDWSHPTEVDIPGAAFDPGTMSEDLNGRTAVIVHPSLYLPPGQTVASTDRVRVRGLDYEVVGEVAEWVNPFTGDRPGGTLSLKRVEG